MERFKKVTKYPPRLYFEKLPDFGAGNIEAVHKASAGGCNAFDFRAAGALFAVAVAAAEKNVQRINMYE